MRLLRNKRYQISLITLKSSLEGQLKYQEMFYLFLDVSASSKYYLFFKAVFFVSINDISLLDANFKKKKIPLINGFKTSNCYDFRLICFTFNIMKRLKQICMMKRLIIIMLWKMHQNWRYDNLTWLHQIISYF